MGKQTTPPYIIRNSCHCKFRCLQSFGGSSHQLGFCEDFFWQNNVVSWPRCNWHAQPLLGCLPPEMVIFKLWKRHTSDGEVGRVRVGGNVVPFFCWDCSVDLRYKRFPTTRMILSKPKWRWNQYRQRLQDSKIFRLRERCWSIERIVIPEELHRVLVQKHKWFWEGRRWFWSRGVDIEVSLTDGLTDVHGCSVGGYWGVTRDVVKVLL